jgi:beta-aspartyl-dipeptidase (metallo-type)
MLSLVRNARLFAPADRGACDLVVCNGQIERLSAGLQDLPAWAETVDLEGRLVIPALVDCHVHVTGGGGEAGAGSRIGPIAADEYRAAGIGTVVGVLGTDDTTRTTGSLVAWTRELGAHGLTARCLTGGYHVPPTTLTGSVRGDIVWIDVIVGVGELAISDHRSSHPTRDELVRIASDAHVAGLMTGKAGIVHVHTGDGVGGLEPIRQALGASELPSGVFHPSHVNRRKALFDEAVALASAGTPIDITAFPVGDDEDAWSAPAALARYLESAAPAHLVTISSDGGGCLPVFDAHGQVVEYDVAMPGALLDSLRQAVGSGIELEDALPAFTTNPAAVLRLPNQGWIGAGSAADLLVLDEDLALHRAMLGGHWFGADGRPIGATPEASA